MALSLVDVGTTANDGTGDPLRTAFQTVNTALTLVDNAVVVGTGVTTFKDDSGSAGVSVLSSGFVGIGTTSPASALHVVADTGADESGLRVQRYANPGQYITIGTFADALIESNGGNKDFIINNASATTGDLLWQIEGNTGLTVKRNATHTTIVNIANLPTSSAGLATGDLWNNSGVLTVA